VDKGHRPGLEESESDLAAPEAKRRFACLALSENVLSIEVQFVNMLICFDAGEVAKRPATI
jgi:hypothetical protein